MRRSIVLNFTLCSLFEGKAEHILRTNKLECWSQPKQGSHAEGKGTVQLTLLVITSLDQRLLILFYKTNYLNEEVNCTELYSVFPV